MKKVYATALFGDGDKYAQYFYAWLLGALNLFPVSEGWQVFIAVDKLAMERFVDLFDLLHREGLLKFRVFSAAPKCKAMLWRAAPVFDTFGPEYVFCRDMDAPPMPRDRACCEQFILSKAAVHTIHDSDQHVGIMGGLCGFWAPEFRKLTGMQSLADLHAFAKLTDEQWDRHGADQDVLNRLVRERPLLTLLEHRYNGWHNGAKKKPKREAGVYVCQAFSTELPNIGHFGDVNFAPVMFHEPFGTLYADHLGAHLGCAGYDHKAAIEFWMRYGDPAIAEHMKRFV